MSTSDKNNPMRHSISRRTFIKVGVAGVAGAGLLAAGGKVAYDFIKTVDVKGRVLIIGGGAAGCSMAARLMRRIEHPDITIVDPSDKQFYQPGFTFIAAGIFQPNEVWMPQEDCIPQGVRWVKDTVTELDPVKQTARTSKGETLQYDFLVLCPGLQLNWDKVEGITQETLG
ncbi:MAG: FAD-dependent oxidoreductase, partial [Bacteroidaceae bacterium]